MESFTDVSGEKYTIETVGNDVLCLISDYSNGIEFYKEDALKIIALITKAAV